MPIRHLESRGRPGVKHAAAVLAAGLVLAGCADDDMPADSEVQAEQAIPADPEVLAGEVAHLHERLDAVESQLGDTNVADMAQRLRAAEAELDALTQQVAALPDADRIAALDANYAQLEERVAALEGGGAAGGAREVVLDLPPPGEAPRAWQEGLAALIDARVDRRLAQRAVALRAAEGDMAEDGMAANGMAGDGTMMEVLSTPPMPDEPMATRYGLHLASYLHMTSFLDGWTQLRRQHSDLLGDMPVTAVEFTKEGNGEGRSDFLRLMAGSFTERAAAEETCASLREAGRYCAVRPIQSIRRF